MKRLVRVSIAAVVCLLACAGAALGQGAATAPKLDSLHPDPSVQQQSDGAIALPRTLTICQDTKAGRCWSASGTSDCPGGSVFRTVAADAERMDASEALRECWENARDRPPPDPLPGKEGEAE